MNNKIKYTDDIFKDKLKDFNIEPPLAVWDNIERGMLARKRKRFIIAPIVGIAASLFILIIPAWLLNFNPFSANNEVSGDFLSQNSEKEYIYNEDDEITSYPDSICDDGLNSLDTKLNKLVVACKNTNGNSNNLLQEVEGGVAFDKCLNKVKDLNVIVVPTKNGDADDNVLLALNNKLSIPSRIKKDSDYEIIKRNIAFLEKKKEKRLKSGLRLDMGQSKISGHSNNILALKESYMPNDNIFNVSPAPAPAVTTKPSVKLKNDFGISMELPLRKNLAFISGVRYLSFRDDKLPEDIDFPSLGSVKDMDDILNDENDIYVTKFKQSFGNIEIPIQIKYYILNNRLSVYCAGGVGLNFLVNNRANVTISNNSTVKSKTNDMADISYSGIIGVGISYNINEKLYVSIEPKYRHYLSSLSDNSLIKIKPKATNVSFGLGFKF